MSTILLLILLAVIVHGLPQQGLGTSPDTDNQCMNPCPRACSPQCLPGCCTGEVTEDPPETAKLADNFCTNPCPRTCSPMCSPTCCAVPAGNVKPDMMISSVEEGDTEEVGEKGFGSPTDASDDPPGTITIPLPPTMYTPSKPGEIEKEMPLPDFHLPAGLLEGKLPSESMTLSPSGEKLAPGTQFGLPPPMPNKPSFITPAAGGGEKFVPPAQIDAGMPPPMLNKPSFITPAAGGGEKFVPPAQIDAGMPPPMLNKPNFVTPAQGFVPPPPTLAKPAAAMLPPPPPIMIPPPPLPPPPPPPMSSGGSLPYPRLPPVTVSEIPNRLNRQPPLLLPRPKGWQPPPPVISLPRPPPVIPPQVMPPPVLPPPVIPPPFISLPRPPPVHVTGEVAFAGGPGASAPPCGGSGKSCNPITPVLAPVADRSPAAAQAPVIEKQQDMRYGVSYGKSRSS